MPIFDYKCPGCDLKIEDKFVRVRTEEVKCIRCGAPMQRLFPNRFSLDIFPADGMFFEHTSPKGNRFYSKKEIKEFAKANDMSFDYLE